MKQLNIGSDDARLVDLTDQDGAMNLLDGLRDMNEMIAQGRGDQRVGLSLKSLDGSLEPTVDTAYKIRHLLVAMQKKYVDMLLELTRAKAGDVVARGGTDDDLAASLRELARRMVNVRRQLLEFEVDFPAELAGLNQTMDDVAALMKEPLRKDPGAGKLRVLDERRLARDANEVRQLPLADKIRRNNRLNDQIAAGSNDIEPSAFHEVNEESKRLIREMTGKPVLKAVEQILEEAFPGMIRAFYPRVYEFAGRYHSPRIMAVMMANVVAEMLRYGYHKSATAYRLMMPGLAYLKERRMPMFFLAPDLLEAVLRTDFDDDINWQDMELPYESGLLMLPKGSLVHPVDGEIAMLMWSRVRQGNQPSPWPGIPMSVLPNDSFVLLGACPDTMIWYDSILTANVRPTMRLNNLFYRAPGEPVPHVERSNFMDADLTDLDAGFVEKMGVILFGTFLAMNARPQLVEHGKLLKRVGKTVEQAREFWSPNVIGAKYKFKREVPHIVRGKFEHSTREGGTHASPRLHWRRGHYRNQPVGPGRKERKTIWLEPCLIGAE